MSDRRSALDLAVRSLAPRERSRRDIEERLERAGFDPEERAAALDELERLGYLDDRRFAAARAEALAERGYGDEWIRHDLDAHGVGGDVALEVLAGLEPEAARAAAEVGGRASDQRLAGRLARRGFGPEAIREALGRGFADTAEGA